MLRLDNIIGNVQDCKSWNGGSNPPLAYVVSIPFTILAFFCESNSMVECNLAKVEAEGSNPFFRLIALKLVKIFGWVTEWLKVPVLKTGVFSNTGGSNPSLSVGLGRWIYFKKEGLTQLVECLAYNEKVSGSSPLFFIFYCPFRLGVRTLPFHGSNTGSNPVRDNQYVL